MRRFVSRLARDPAAPPDRARRMRWLASGLLGLMACLFVAARHFAGNGETGVWAALRAFSEAAMVGGLADWFAVTALFRHPLGLPIPHTAIIPANKNRIADSMAQFLRANFLTAAVVARRLAGVNMAAALGAWLADPARQAEFRLRRAGAALLRDLLEALDGERQVGRFVKRLLRRQLEKLDVATLAGEALGAAIAEQRHRPLIEGALRWAGMTLEDNEELLRGVIHTRANAILRWTGLDERLANGILDGLYRLLAECIVDPGHPMRRRIEEGLETLAHDLREDPAMRARVARFRAEALANPALATWLDAGWEGLRARLLAALEAPENLLSGGGGAGLAAFGRTLEADPRLQAMLNRFARRLIAGTASRYGTGIVTLVSETVKRWDARTVASRVEAAVGRDLQFIRINGTLVGGLVGLALYALGRVL